MRRPSPAALIIGAAITQLAVGVAIVAITATYWLAPPSPVARITTDDGTETVLNWADYPGDPSLDPDDVLAAPRAEDVSDVGDTELAALRSAADTAAPDLTWESDDTGTEDSLLNMTVGGNGYGGQSLHRIYNSPNLLSDGLTEDANWAGIGAALDDELIALGYDTITWDFERPPYDYQTRADRDAEILDQFGSLDPERMWSWTGIAERDSMWVSVTIWDDRRGAPEAYWSTESGISLSVGGTVVAASDEDTYEAGVAPFAGLPRPKSTRSD